MNKLEIKYQNVSDLKPYENNPRYNEDAVKYVANSIKEFGFKVPIVVDKDNVIIAGHTRLLAAIDLGLEEVPTVVADELSEDQVKAFRLADNKVSEQATWDILKLDEELDILKDTDIDMSDFGFGSVDIDWDTVEELKDDTYEEPEHDMLECPKCHHIDRTIHFKKVSSTEEIDEDIS